LGLVETAVLCEQLGRCLAPVPFLGTVLVAGALRAAVADGTVASSERLGEAEVRAWIDRLSSGQAMGAVGWSRLPSSMTAATAAGGWTLSGRSDLVVHGPAADVIVVFAETGGVPALLALVPDTAHRPTPEPAMDRTRSVGWLTLDGAPATFLGGAGPAARLLDRAVAGVSAEMLGGADRVLHMTVDYAKDRIQFGRPIGGFQAVKHRCADMLVDVEGMRSATYYAAWAVGADDPEADAAASVAKVWSSDASRRVMASGLQVHGGIGFTWEHDLHLFLKRAQLDQMSFGDAGYHRQRLAQILRPKAEAGQPVL